MLAVLESNVLSKVDSTLLCEYILTQVDKFGMVSHLKLQKLLYYVQGFHLAYFDAPAVDDDFEAWVHGPVSRKIYDEMKGASVLHAAVSYVPKPGEAPPALRLSETFSADQLDLVNDVLAQYGPLSAYALESQTHSELPWVEARRGYGPADSCEVVINRETMRAFYKEFLYGEA